MSGKTNGSLKSRHELPIHAGSKHRGLIRYGKAEAFSLLGINPPTIAGNVTAIDVTNTALVGKTFMKHNENRPIREPFLSMKKAPHWEYGANHAARDSTKSLCP